ncbi:MAG TPA: type IV toxin-antitoxin system AbiEi family antitoxin domain-containing protein, partial [Acidimicrobiia bacterium]
MNVDVLLAQAASRQHSVITRQQLRDLGLTRDQIDYRIEVGLLVVKHPATYLVAGSQRTHEQNVMAACLATGGVASHRCAAGLFRLRGCR